MERFTIGNSDFCADTIWRKLLETDHRNQVLEEMGLSFGPGSVIAPGSQGKERPTDWFITYAAVQALVRPSLFSSNKTLKSMKPLEAREAIVKAVRDLKRIHFSEIRTALDFNPKHTELIKAHQTYVDHRDLLRAGVTMVVNQWRSKNRRGERPVRLFGRDDFTGPEAITRLREALVEGLVPAIVPYRQFKEARDRKGWLASPTWFGGEPFKFVKDDGSDPRDSKLEDFCDAAFNPSNGVRLINGHATGLRGGLTAFAAELFKPKYRTNRQCTLPMLYLPLHGRMEDPPKDSFGALAFEIWQFYFDIHKSEHGAAAPSGHDRKFDPPESLDETIALLQATHRLMADYPAIVLFDGYRSVRCDTELSDYALPNLIAAIAGDRLFDLIQRLVLIPTPGAEPPIDVERFQSNRFIVLSDKPIYSDDMRDGFARSYHPHPAARLIAGKSIQIPPPRREFLSEILRSFGNQHPDQIAWILDNVAPEEPVDRDALQASFEAHTQALLELAEIASIRQMAVSESLFGVLSTMVMLGIRVPPGFTAEHPDFAVRRLIESVLWPALKIQKPRFRVLLHLIAISPGGLRPKTLARVYEHYLDALYVGKSRVTREVINETIVELLTTCHGLINVLRSDHLDALSGRPVPLLFRRGYGFGNGEPSCERTIEFAFEEVRELILSQPLVMLDGPPDPLLQEPDPRYLPFLHLLLAEEAYEQFTHLARYDDHQAEESLHRNNRILTTLYHGAASLGDDRLETLPLYPGTCQFFPDNPTDRWVKLYSFAYRKNLDRPPQHDLVRRFDAAQTKLDILLSLARPQLCRSTELPPSGWRLPQLAAGPSQVPLAQRENILQQFAMELRQAGLAVSRRLEIDWVAAGVGGDDARETLAKLAEAAIHLTDQPQSRDEEVEQLSTTIIGEMGRLLGTNAAPRDPDRAHRDPIVRLLNFVTINVARVLNGAHKADLISPDREAWIFASAQIPPDKMKLVVDFLNLYAEIVGLRAERDYGAQLATKPSDPTPEVVDGFVRSFAAFYIAEYLRERIFWSNPSFSRDAIGGRSARGYIRVSLKLERLRVTLAGRSGGDMKPGGWFWQHAHRVSDEFARHLSRFPRERVSNLILDATMARYYESNLSENYPRYLQMARECLRSAEPLAMKLSMHNRLRQRFALERAKVLAESARLAMEAGQFDDAERFLLICETDIESFERIARPDDLLWKNLATLNRSRTSELRASLEAAKLGASASPPPDHPALD